MKYRYIENLRHNIAHSSTDVSKLKSKTPKFASKQKYRQWCADAKTKHVFYTSCEGRTPSKRISNDNPVNMLNGLVADYDASVDWKNIDDDISARFGQNPPTWRSKTNSGYMRLVWEFDEPLPIAPELFDTFMRHISKTLKMSQAFAGFDSSSLRASQYFELGEDWVNVGGQLDTNFVQTILAKAAADKPPQSTETSIPIEVVAKEVESRFPNRWIGDFEVGSRGPLFWIDDGIDRDGCQVVEDGVVCYSDRAGRGFMSWADIFGSSFTKDYETRKLATLLDEYWFNGRNFYKLSIHDSAISIPKDQLLLELRQAGFSMKTKKGQPLSEVESAILTISNHNRIDEIAPVVFSNERIVSYNGSRILNCANNSPIEPEVDGDPANWPFLHKWIGQLFEDSGDVKAVDYFYAWLKRFYRAAYERRFDQGQALVLVGPTGRGKSLLSNRVIGTLVGGFSDASDYISGQTRFNKDLGRVAAWVIDDTTSAASFQDQRKATEILKRSVANPRVEYQAKYADSMSVPWTGRVILSLNMDANSLSVIPSLDSSNRDKIIALRIREEAVSEFPPNDKLEAVINSELPYLATYLIGLKVSPKVEGTGRFGVKSFIDPSIADAAYDNSYRSAIAELVEFFTKRCREINTDMKEWKGTLTEFQVSLHDFNNGRSVGMSNNLEFVRRGMCTLEDAGRVNKKIRPIKSRGQGGGKLWTISLSSSYDIDSQGNRDVVLTV